MSDEEQQAEEAPSAPAPAAQSTAQGEDEGRRKMEEAKQARAEKQRQEMAEYEEMRKEEREREKADIQALRERRAHRLQDREEEEKRTVELRTQEEARRKAEEEDRKQKKAVEELDRNEEREKKRQAAEERLKPKKPNYVITKKDGSSSQTPEMSMGREIYQKSKEQLEEEKRAILSQRIPLLIVDGLDSNRLNEKAKELHQLVRKLEGDKYDSEQQYKRQQYDMIELQERARQMNKGKKGTSSVQVDESFDRLADKHTGAPPKIALCSKYERHTDHRTYVERMDLFEELAKPPPAIEIQHVDVPWQPEGMDDIEEEVAA